MPALGDDLSLSELRARYEAARTADHGSAETRQTHLDAAVALSVRLVDELEDDDADRVLGRIGLLLEACDTRLEIATRRRLADELTGVRARDRAIAQLRVAQERARDLPELAAELARALGALETSEPRSVQSETAALLEAAARVTDPELGAAIERSLAQRMTGAQAIHHARRSLEHAHETVEPQIIADAISYLCELLVESLELDEAKALLEQRPPTRDGRADRALYDEIRRRRGEFVPDPSEEPDEPAQVAPAVIAYLTRPTNLARACSDGGLPSTAKLREWSAGALRVASDLESQRIFGPVRSFWCACGRFRGREYADMGCRHCGVEVVHASSRRTRVGCIVLDAPVVHPWYASAAGVLLDASAAQVLAMSVDELRAKLRTVDIAALAQRFKGEIVTAPRAKIADEAGRRLALVEAFRHALGPFGTTPESIVLEVILVAPPHGELGFDRARVREAYASILAAPGDPLAVAGLFAALART